jgi:hypothetical protein
VLVDWVLAGLEETLHECLVDNRHRHRGFVIGLGEVTATQDWDGKILQILAAHAVPRGSFFIHFRRRMACDVNHLAPVIGEGIIERQSRSLHARQTIEAIFDLTIECVQSRQSIGRGRVVQPN